MESSSNSNPAQPSLYQMSHLLRSLTIPRKLSNSSLFHSTSLPVRAPLTLDDDDEENDTEIESNDNHSESSTVISTITASDGEPDEEELSASNDNGVRVSLKPFVRPIAKLNWDSDSSDDDDNKSEVDSRGGFDFSPLVVSSVVGKVSVAPRVGVFEFDDDEEEEEGFDLVAIEKDSIEKSSMVEIDDLARGIEEEEEDEKEGFGSLEGREEFDLAASENDLTEKSLKAEIEGLLSEEEGFDGGFGGLKGCEEKSDLAASGNDLIGKSSMAEIDECSILAPSEEEGFDGDFGGLKGCQEEEEDATEKISEAKIEECREEFKNSVLSEEEEEEEKEEGGFDDGLKSLSEGCEEFDLTASEIDSTEKISGSENEEFKNSASSLERGEEESDFCEKSSEACEEESKNDAIENCSKETHVGSLEDCEEFNLAPKEEKEEEEIKGCEEELDLSPSKNDVTEMRLKLEIEECNVVENKVESEIYEAALETDSLGVLEACEEDETRKCSEIDSGFEIIETEECCVIVSETEVTKEPSFVLSNIAISDESGRDESDSSAFRKLSNRDDDDDINVEESTVQRSSEEDQEISNDEINGSSLKIMVLGRSGVGKSSTINLILSESKALVNAFEPSTVSIEEIVGTVNGSEIRILDTPGLRSDRRSNRKILDSVRRRLKKFSPDIVLYIDRSDTWDDEDRPIVSLITSSLGPSIWEKAAIVLSHSSSSSEISVDHKSRAIERCIRESPGNRNLNLRGRVSLVENHPTANEDSNGRSELLLLCYSMKKRLVGGKKNEVSCVSRNHTESVFSRFGDGFGARVSMIVGLAMVLQIAISGLNEK